MAIQWVVDHSRLTLLARRKNVVSAAVAEGMVAVVEAATVAEVAAVDITGVAEAEAGERVAEDPPAVVRAVIRKTLSRRIFCGSFFIAQLIAQASTQGFNIVNFNLT
jgi:predicted transcriptional regulator